MLNGLREVGFEPDVDMRNELMGLDENGIGFDELYDRIANTERP